MNTPQFSSNGIKRLILSSSSSMCSARLTSFLTTRDYNYRYGLARQRSACGHGSRESATHTCCVDTGTIQRRQLTQEIGVGDTSIAGFVTETDAPGKMILWNCKRNHGRHPAQRTVLPHFSGTFIFTPRPNFLIFRRQVKLVIFSIAVNQAQKRKSQNVITPTAAKS